MMKVYEAPTLDVIKECASSSMDGRLRSNPYRETQPATAESAGGMYVLSM